MFRKEAATETSWKSCFRTPFGNQRVNEFQTPLKLARHHYYPLFPWIPGELSWKKTALLWSKTLRLFANTLTADDKYSCRNMQNFLQQLQTLLSEKTEDFFWIFYCISEMCMKFRTFWRKGWVSQPNYFRNYCFGKRLLLKRLECLSSEHPSVVNVLTGSKSAQRYKVSLLSFFPMTSR